MQTRRSSTRRPLASEHEGDSSANCFWTPEDEEALICYLVEHKAEAGDNGNFKPATWTAAATLLEAQRTKGGSKTAKACSTKYSRLRSTYSVVLTLRGLSGFSWHPERGMNIGVAEQSAWDQYTAKNTAAKPFAHKGFRLYDLMTPLMPRLGKDTKTFRPSQQTYGAASSSLTMHRQSPNDNDNTAKDNGPSGTATQNPPRDRDCDKSMPPPPLPASSNEAVPSPSPPAPSLRSLTAASTATINLKRKHSALSMSRSESSMGSTGSGGKKARTMAMSQADAAALNGIKESLDAFNHTINCIMQPEHRRSDISLDRRAKAVKRVQELESGLDDGRLIALMDLFKNTSDADAYLCIEREALRKKWVEKRLSELGFPDDLNIRP